MTQPLTLRLDPRVKTSAAGLAQLATLTRRMYDGATSAAWAYVTARALVARLDSLQDSEIDAFKAQVLGVAPAAVRGPPAGFGPGRTGPAGPPTLETVSTAMLAAAMAMQGADVTPTAREVAACDRARADSRVVLGRWAALETTGLAALNAKLRAAGHSPVVVPRVTRPRAPVETAPADE